MNAIVMNNEDAYKDNVWIATQNGKFELDNPTFDIRDIAHALARCCRFNGHINGFWSVADHSILVADIMLLTGQGNPLEGLLHDATEAYLSDVPAPFKTRLPDWQGIDKKLELEFRKKFRLPEKKSPECGKADWYALFIEAHVLHPQKGEGFADPLNLREEALELYERSDGWKLWDPKMALTFRGNFTSIETEFIQSYKEYAE